MTEDRGQKKTIGVPLCQSVDGISRLGNRSYFISILCHPSSDLGIQTQYAAPGTNYLWRINGRHFFTVFIKVVCGFEDRLEPGHASLKNQRYTMKEYRKRTCDSAGAVYDDHRVAVGPDVLSESARKPPDCERTRSNRPQSGITKPVLSLSKGLLESAGGDKIQGTPWCAGMIVS